VSYTRFIAGALITALGTHQTPHRGRLGSSDVERIGSTINRLDAHFNGLGGGALLDVAVDYLARLERALDQCTYGERIERSLYRAVAEVAACAGWSAHDCGQYAHAAELRNRALQAALLSQQGQPLAVAAVAVSDGLITGMYILSDPERLAGLGLDMT
jgi:hypothetical protein